MSTSIFTDTMPVYYQVSKLFPGENINKDDIFEMCINAELLYINDGDLLAKYVDVPVEIDQTLFMGALPCNVKRLLEVYDKDENNIEYQLTGSNHIKVKDKIDKVYVHYLGIKMDENGNPTIRTNHIPALVSFCVKSILEPKMLVGKASPQVFQMYDNKFSNQIINIKQSATNKDIRHYRDIDIIRFDMIPNVGQIKLFKNMFK